MARSIASIAPMLLDGPMLTIGPIGMSLDHMEDRRTASNGREREHRRESLTFAQDINCSCDGVGSRREPWLDRQSDAMPDIERDRSAKGRMECEKVSQNMCLWGKLENTYACTGKVCVCVFRVMFASYWCGEVHKQTVKSLRPSCAFIKSSTGWPANVSGSSTNDTACTECLYP